MKSRSLLILFVVFQYFSFSTELASSSKTTLLQKVFVKEIRIVNSSIFARADFEGLFTSYEKRDLQFEEMEELRSKASEAYLEKGFINSGFILDDRIIDGVIILRAIEGDLSKIEISGNGYFKPDFLRKRLKRHAGKPFNLLALQRSLQKLRYDQRIKRLRAKFSPGVGQGSGVLDLKLKEHQPFKWTVHGGNDKPPSVGEKSYGLSMSRENLRGRGDTLRVSYSTTQGLKDYELEYILPQVSGNRFQLRWSRHSSSLLEEPFDLLDIKSRTSNFSLGFSRQLNWNTANESNLEFSLHHKNSQSFLLGEPFSLSDGAVDGRARVTSLEFAQNWVKRDLRRVISSGYSLNKGIDLLGSTQDDSGINQDFLFLRTSMDWMERSEAHKNRLVLFRLHSQITGDSLPPVFKYSLGGMRTVRGYRENHILRDNGLLSSLEFRLPIHPLESSNITEFQLVPFMDWGRGWDANDPQNEIKSAMSIGLGIRTHYRNDLSLQIYYGHALRGKSSGTSLQDKGFHFQFDWHRF